jgi:Trypsin-like peptidase domain
MQAKNSILSGILFTIIFVTISCNEQQTQSNTNSGSTKNIKEFSSKELYTEMEARNKNKFALEKKQVDTPPIINHDLSNYSDKEIYDALVVYGVDNRKNPFDNSITDSNMLLNYKKVACLVDTSRLKKQPDGNYKLIPSGLHTTYGNQALCTEENFYGEPIASFCTGFAVSETMFATAGHCLDENDFKKAVFIYGYAMKDSVTPNLIINKANVYKPKQIVGRELDKKTNNDYCIIEVDRKIPSNLICMIRQKGTVSKNEKLYVIGYPSGLPVKITPGGEVYVNDNPFYFLTNLDTYGGNSGSPVFNANTHLIEGILVRGATDYTFWDIGGCYRSNICPEDIGNCGGEGVTRASQFVKWIK